MYTIINIILHIVSWIFTIGIFYLFWFGIPHFLYKNVDDKKWFKSIENKHALLTGLLFYFVIILCFIAPFIVIRNIDFLKKGIKVMVVREKITRDIFPYAQ